MILIAGASGQLGGLIAHSLLQNREQAAHRRPTGGFLA